MEKNKHPGGRPTKYKPEYCEEIIDFFSVSPAQNVKFPTLVKFANKIGVCDDIFVEWAKVHPKFSDALKKVKKLQEDFLIDSGLTNTYAQPMTIFALKNIFKWTDRQEIKHEITDLAAEMEEARKRLKDD